MNIRRVFADRLKKAREEAGLSQRELGLLIGLSDKSISAYEQERVLPPFDIVPKLAKQLNKPIAYFIEEEEPLDFISIRLIQIEREIEEFQNLLKDLKEELAKLKNDNKERTV